MLLRHLRNGVQRVVELGDGFHRFTVGDLAAALNGAKPEHPDTSAGSETSDGLANTAQIQAGDTSPDALAGSETSDNDGTESGLAASDDCGAESGGNPAGLVIDGRWHTPGTRLSSVALWEGSLVEVRANPPSGDAPSGNAVWCRLRPQGARDARAAPLMLAVTGGLRSGVGYALPAPLSRRMIGRDAGCHVVLDDPAVSRRHAVVEAAPSGRLTICDLGARNGIVVAGRAVAGRSLLPAGAPVRLGATVVELRRAVDDVPAAVNSGLGAAAGRVPFNRPPRRRAPIAPSALRVPSEPPAQGDPEPLSWAGIVLPVVAGLVLAIVWSPFMAVFAVLGPLLTIGTWLERRRRAAKSHRRACGDVAEQVRRLRASLPAARAAERRRRVALVPDLAEIVRRACAPSVRCWERRLTDPDALKLGIGTGEVAFAPPLEVVEPGTRSATTGAAGVAAAADAVAAVEAMAPLKDIPVAISARPGEVIGIVGPPAACRTVARGLVLQAAVLHGPADLATVALAPGLDDDWGWMRWLPHTADPGGGHGALVATDADMSASVEAVTADPSERATLLLIDGPDALTGRGAPARVLLNNERTAAIVITDDTDDLPAACTTIVEVTDTSGGLRLVDPLNSVVLEPLIAWGVTADTALEAAAHLARLDDPELGVGNAGLPASVSLVDLLGGKITPESVSKRWAATRGTPELAAPIGVDGAGPVVIDLVTDGPHLLVGGTTGSGKSELLRSLVAGLALSSDPEHLAFVLIDYKGGAAFDRCADLPHVAGMVTDLDDRLAERAMVCLEAELRRREQRLRAVGADDLAAFRALNRGGADPGAGGAEPLPRLVVAVDEFATLAAELPDFLDALVGIAQRGRSLGVHMLLATQRPAGVVTEDIRANTSCRIALRVTDKHDSNDVIGSPDAAAIPRQRPGRALARFGPGELTAFQAALVTGTTPPASSGLRISAVTDASDSDSPPSAASVLPEDCRSDLDAAVEAAREAHKRLLCRVPGSPWPAPLPDDISLDSLAEGAELGSRAAWLVDDPARQRQFTWGWRPDDGHLVVIGRPGSGTSTTLVSVTLELCRTMLPHDLHVYGIDFDGGLLEALEGLPHTGSIVTAADSERRLRLLRVLDEEIADRRASREGGNGGPQRAARPQIVLVIDKLSGLARSHDPVRDPEPHERLRRIWGDGPAAAVTCVVSAGRAAELPPELAASAGVVLVHATAGADDALRFGLRTDTAGLRPGRAIRADDRRELQVGRPPAGAFSDAAAAVASAAGGLCGRDDQAAGLADAPSGGPMSIGVLPSVVPAGVLGVGGTLEERRVRLRFAMCDLRLRPIGFALHDGEHAMVLGPPRTGRTSALAAIGVAARRAGASVLVVSDRPSSDLAALLGVAPITAEQLDAAGPQDGPSRCVALIDDADMVRDSPDGALAGVVSDRGSRLHVVASATAERVRSSYGHWLTEMRSCRTGLLLRPGPLDGDLLGVALPPRLGLAPRPGLALIIENGAAELCQVALLEP